MNLVSGFRNYIFNLKDSNMLIDKKITMYFFIIFFWIGGLITWQNYLSLLPIISMTLTSFALWSSNTKHIRILFLSGRPFFIIYNFFVGSYAGLVTEAFLTFSIFAAIVRFDVLNKKENKYTN